MRKFLFSLSVLVVLLFPVTGFGVPDFLSHQGRIIQANNTPLAGSANVEFSLYSNVVGGSQEWSQSMSVTFEDGYYSVVLGPGSPTMSTDLFDGGDLYLGVTLEGEDEFSPRQRIISVPYAMSIRHN